MLVGGLNVSNDDKIKINFPDVNQIECFEFARTFYEAQMALKNITNDDNRKEMAEFIFDLLKVWEKNCISDANLHFAIAATVGYNLPYSTLVECLERGKSYTPLNPLFYHWYQSFAKTILVKLNKMSSEKFDEIVADGEPIPMTKFEIDIK